MKTIKDYLLLIRLSSLEQPGQKYDIVTESFHTKEKAEERLKFLIENKLVQSENFESYIILTKVESNTYKRKYRKIKPNCKLLIN